jgi:hypothetical protein
MRNSMMKYKIVEVPLIYYEVQDENGEIYHDDEGDNLLDTIKEAEELINILKLDEAIRERHQ